MDAEAIETSLNDRDSVTILLRLYDTGRKMNLSELRGQQSNYNSLMKRLLYFEEDGLVNLSLEQTPKKVVLAGLTPKGRKVGDLLDSIRKILPPGDISDSALSLKYAAPVIVMLYRMGPLKHSDILEVIPSYGPLVKKLFPALEETGIVRQWTKESGYRSHMIELDGIGKAIGPLMNKAFELIKKK